MHDIVRLSVSAEKLISAIYSMLAKRFHENEPGSEVLQMLAAQELGHALALEKILAELPDAKSVPFIDFGRVLKQQAAFIDTCADMMIRINTESPDALVEELIMMEGQLAENLFTYLQFVVSPTFKDVVKRLAEESDSHSEILKSIYRQ